MTRAPKPASTPYVPGAPLHYLMTTSDAGRHASCSSLARCSCASGPADSRTGCRCR